MNLFKKLLIIPFKDITKWTPKEFPDSDQTQELKDLADEETRKDLQKTIQQLLSDVHAECLNPLPEQKSGEEMLAYKLEKIILQLQRLIGAQKRTASLQAVNAFEATRLNAYILLFTFALVILTFVLVFISFFQGK